MIDYSVFMMGNPMDVDAAQKAYAKAQVSEIMPFSQFVKHIADHNGVFTRGTVKGVIADMCECLVEMLLEGKKVQLAELGNFWISIGSEGAEDLKKFTESNITRRQHCVHAGRRLPKSSFPRRFQSRSKPHSPSRHPEGRKGR